MSACSESMAKALAAELVRLGVGDATRAQEQSGSEHYNRVWVKAAKEIGLKKLRIGNRVSLMGFIEWREGVERWARIAGGDMKMLPP